MSLFKKNKNDIQELELSDKHMGLRFALFVGFLIIGLSAIAYFVTTAFSEDPGWQTIEPTDKSFMVEGEFTFNYNLGCGEKSATDEKRALRAAYSEALGNAYKLFDVYRAYPDIINVKYINSHPNEVLTVHEDLYKAFELLETFENRSIYLAPVQAQYRNLFGCTDDGSAATFDPYKDRETEAFIGEIVSFTSDSSSVAIELLGENKLRLNLSDEYLSYAAENGIDIYIDFSWLTNAFVADLVAEELISAGYTRGYLLSYDGYVRYLDANENSYAVKIYDRYGSEVFTACEAVCAPISALVQLRDYPIHSRCEGDYYRYADGIFASRYVDTDGFYKSSVHDINAYSESVGCAEIALTLSAAFIADEINADILATAETRDIHSVWCEEHVIRYTAEGSIFEKVYSGDDVRYTTQLVK